MTPTRECVILLSGQEITIPVGNEVDSLEEHVQKSLEKAVLGEPDVGTDAEGNEREGLVSLITIGPYNIVSDAILGWYMRDFRPDEAKAMTRLAAKYLEQQMGNDD